jgi:hypothetical protein
LGPSRGPRAAGGLTLPYNSINEREVGTTFGLRAQDAIGWNPRSFRFLKDPGDFREARSIYLSLFGSQNVPTDGRSAAANARLLELEKAAASGEFRILDARIEPGIADPKPYAQAWALAGSRMQHEVETVSPGQESALGKLVWIRFSLTLWLPVHWSVPAGIPATRVSCPR